MPSLRPLFPYRPDRNPEAHTSRQAKRWAATLTTLYVILGYGSQANLIVSRRSAGDLSPAFVVLGLLAYGSWTWWAFLPPRQLEIALPNLLGGLFSIGLLILWFIFR